MNGGRYNGGGSNMIDESMNVSDESQQSEAVKSSEDDNEGNKNGPKAKSNSKNRINESSLPNMRSKK